MNRTIQLIFILITTFFAVNSANAQDQLILAKGDTLSGTIELLLPSTYYEEIAFENDDLKERYKAHEFVQFEKEGTTYRTVKFGDKYRVMQVEKEGYLSLLRFRADEAYGFNGFYLGKRSGEGIEVPNLFFKKAMANFLDDCGSVREAIVEDAYRKKDLEKLIDDYNLCMEAQTETRMEEYRESQIREAATPLMDQISNLIKQSDNLGDEELSNMLGDVMDKVRSGENVPNYLKNALTSHVENNHALKQAVENLLKQL